MHKGHRKRLKNRALTEGLDKFEDHNVLELLLFFSVIQRDTNPIGHQLLEKFGSLHGVFDASYEDLLKVEGIGDHSASLIKLIPELSRKYMMDRSKQIKILSETSICGEYLLPKFIGRKNEVVILTCVDNMRRVLYSSVIFEGCISSAFVSARRIIEIALSVGATAVIISHNHPSGTALPSQEDITTTEQIKKALNAVDITLLDHIIVHQDDFISFAESGLL